MTRRDTNWYVGSGDTVLISVYPTLKYIPVKTTGDIKRVEYNNVESFEVVTGVDAIEIKDADDAAIYNLQGVRVAHPQKGIYVKNGKKYVK